MNEKDLQKAGKLLARRAEVDGFRRMVAATVSFSYPTVSVGRAGDDYQYEFQGGRDVNRQPLVDAMHAICDEEIAMINTDLRALGVEIDE